MINVLDGCRAPVHGEVKEKDVETKLRLKQQQPELRLEGIIIGDPLADFAPNTSSAKRSQKSSASDATLVSILIH
jgi:hypothetical protein